MTAPNRMMTRLPDPVDPCPSPRTTEFLQEAYARAVAHSPYVIEYSARFGFPVTPDVLWSALEDNDRFESWWGWLTDLRVEGDGLQVGSVLTGVVTPPLPYRIQLRVVVVGCVPRERLEAEVHGDLEGHAHLSLEPVGNETVAAVAWTVEMQQRPMVHRAASLRRSCGGDTTASSKSPSPASGDGLSAAGMPEA